MKKAFKVFIDGSAGTTGLKIRERIERREDVKIIELGERERKTEKARSDAINSSDVTFLCLPDDAARQAVSFVENPDTVIIDASTAHRTEEGWLYGFPEVIDDFAEKVKVSKRICVPGCHAGGFIALIRPLVLNGVIGEEAALCCTSVTGYSGGGKKMIAEYESENRDKLLDFPRQYGLSQTHKHLKEMTKICNLKNPPAFSPIVAPFYSGMEVTVPLFAKDLAFNSGKKDIEKIYSDLYTGKIVRFTDENENGFISAGAFSGKDFMRISVFGNEERILLCARYDNLGKGASGAAIECFNYVIGADPEKGLVL